MTNHLPLHSLGVLLVIIGEPICNRKLCDGIPKKFSKFKNRQKSWLLRQDLTTVLIDLNNISLSRNEFCILKLIALNLIYLGPK